MRVLGEKSFNEFVYVGTYFSFKSNSNTFLEPIGIEKCVLKFIGYGNGV